MIDFNNLKIAFHDKSDQDLNRAYFLFKIISNPFISKFLTLAVKIALWLNLPIISLIKITVYKHFCGNTDLENSQKTIDKLWKYKIGTILNYSAEGKESEEEFNKVMNEVIKSINKAKSKENIPFSVFKLTGLAQFSLLEKLNEKTRLTDSEEIEKKKFMNRIRRICNNAKEKEVPIFIDAEESWIQDITDNIARDMMKQFNKDQALIFNTVQMYRKDRMNYMNQLLNDAKRNNYFIGVKLVRGAYHEQEIKRSNILKYECPVYTEKENTDSNYNKGIEFCMRNINKISVCIATHNEESTSLMIELMQEYKIQENDKRIFFSQLLGMSDHISYNVAKEGYNIAKYVPYGPVKQVIPYLIRRAKENASIAGQMGRELKKISKEKNRRKQK